MSHHLLQVTVYRKGDRISHRKTGRYYTVDYVRISGRALTIVTDQGEVFVDFEIKKVN